MKQQNILHNIEAADNDVKCFKFLPILIRQP